MKNPSPQINPADVAVKYAKYMAFVYTGGLSYLAEVVVDKIMAEQDVCTHILDGTVFDGDGGEASEVEKNVSQEQSKVSQDKGDAKKMNKPGQGDRPNQRRRK